MTASWVALENVHPNSGPLVYYPGSHKNHIWDYDELGLRLHWGDLIHDGNPTLQNEYSLQLHKALTKIGLKPQIAVMNRGESFLWAASLVHGGSKVKDKRYTRKSQVTHYYLDGAQSYWAPLKSLYHLGKIAYKCQIPSCYSIPSSSNGNHIDCITVQREFFKSRRRVTLPTTEGILCA